jgi:hypothetical protein
LTPPKGGGFAKVPTFRARCVAAVGAFNLGGQSMVALNFYYHGDQAAETAARETPMWQSWFQER